MDRCLICGRTPADNHHFPLTRRYGKSTVPLCRLHHTEAHWGDVEVIELLIKRAPAYWMEHGKWEEAGPVFDTWMSKRAYRRAVAWVE